MKATRISLHLQEAMAGALNRPVVIQQALPIHGGSINESFILETSSGNFFLKKNTAADFPGMFEAEKSGLNRLRAAAGLKIPECIVLTQYKESQYLILEYFERGNPGNAFWENFGRALAGLHKITTSEYGLETNNYIGSLPQDNTFKKNWPQFFTENRIEPQLLLALNLKKITRNTYDRFQELYKKLDHIFPVELPSLLHGDLWSGNFLCSSNQEPVVFDPAVYYGHREMDIAMTKLFGGFHDRFYSAYNECWPMENDWKKRTEICNLYPLLVHLNLFGGGYQKQIELILNQYA